ncbi:hypothetical protein [Brachybacterium hainanense]|uniref:GPP34 family phosphoprotein n=1 Tax=Brachybacterium hainanense TaxID=1541174 RepID=A0ABV6R8I7_9MICO
MQHAAVGYVRRAVLVLEHIGRGRALDLDGGVDTADLRALASVFAAGTTGPSRGCSRAEQVERVIHDLCAGGWLVCEETRLRPGDTAAPYVEAEIDPGAFAHFAESLLMARLAMQRRDLTTGSWHPPSIIAFRLVLCASRGDGLVLRGPDDLAVRKQLEAIEDPVTAWNARLLMDGVLDELRVLREDGLVGGDGPRLTAPKAVASALLALERLVRADERGGPVPPGGAPVW